MHLIGYIIWLMLHIMGGINFTVIKGGSMSTRLGNLSPGTIFTLPQSRSTYVFIRRIGSTIHAEELSCNLGDVKFDAELHIVVVPTVITDEV